MLPVCRELASLFALILLVWQVPASLSCHMGAHGWVARISQTRERSPAANSRIHLVHKWRLINYYFVFMLIILTSPVCTNKIQNNFCFKVRLVRMITIETTE